MAFCFAHPTVESTGTCDDCKAAICTRCTKGTLDGFMCPPCAHRRYARRRLVTGLKVAGIAALLLVTAIGGLLIVGKGSERATPKAAALPPGEKDPLIAALREQRDLAPCDKHVIRRLVEELSKVDRYADVVDDANRFFAKCGPFPRLEWKVVYALQQLGRFAEAVKHSTVLIHDDPFDSDFWWWRGEDHARSGRQVQALADYRQSFANSERVGAARFPAARILDVAGPAGQPCEAVAALDFFTGWMGGSLDDDFARRARGLDLSARCDALRGTGRHVVLLARAAGDAMPVEATVGGVKGRFLFDERCGTTVLSSAFAASARLAPRGGDPIETVALGGVQRGVPGAASIAIGGASAPGVEVVVVDGLPADLDGVIGLSFVWQFELVDGDEDGVALVGHGRPAAAAPAAPAPATP